MGLRARHLPLVASCRGQLWLLESIHSHLCFDGAFLELLSDVVFCWVVWWILSCGLRVGRW